MMLTLLLILTFDRCLKYVSVYCGGFSLTQQEMGGAQGKVAYIGMFSKSALGLPAD